MIRKRIFSIILIITIIISSFQILFNFDDVSGSTLYVGSSSTYKTIQSAIDAAIPGDTIIVSNGTYYESVTISKANIKLIGNGSTDCKIIHHYDGKDYLFDFAAAINVTTSNVTITGFNIIVTGNFTYGICLNSSSSNATIINNYISTAGRFGYGIFLYRSTKNKIINNTINTTGQYGYGIYLVDSSNNNSIGKNKIHTIGPIGFGIDVTYSLFNNISGNRINASGLGSRGIEIYGSKYINLTGNTITNPEQYGIYLFKSSNNNLTRNQINVSIQSSHGIYLYNSSKNNLTNNSIKVSNKANIGIRLVQTSNNNNLIKNRVNVTNQFGTGIHLDESLNNNLTENVINTSEKFCMGINLFITSKNNLINNTLISTGYNGYGVNLYKSSRNNVSQNQINTTGDYGYGIFLNSSSTNNNIINNTINTNGNYSYGIYLYKSPINKILNNSIITNGQSADGVFLYRSSKNIVFNNIIYTILENSYGINLYVYSINNELIQNTINTSQRNGIGIFLYYDSNYNNLTENYIYTSGQGGLGINSFRSANNNFTNNIINISGQRSAGIYLYRSSNNNLTDNKVFLSEDYGYGIHLYISQNNKLLINNITTTGKSSYGVYINWFSIDNILDMNLINTTGQTGYGIYLNHSSRNNNLINNTIKTTGQAGYSIYLHNSTNNYLMDNNINTSGYHGYGIYLLKSSTINFTSESISTSGTFAYGIFLEESGNNNLIDSNIVTNGLASHGIYLNRHSENNNISINIINVTGYGADGIFLQDSNKNNLINNIINSSSQEGTGIYILDSSNNKIIKNIICAIGLWGNGIYLYDYSTFNNTIKENVIKAIEIGIRLEFASNNNITNNNIQTSGSSGSGFYLYRSSNNNIIGNDIFTNGQFSNGINLNFESNNNVVVDNTINSTGYNGRGIFIRVSDNNYILNCSIITHGGNGNGFYLEGKFATIVNSTIKRYGGGWDIVATQKGIITAINTSFKNVQLTHDNGGLVKVMNYLDIQVYHDDGATPLSGADVEITDNNIQIYASSQYNGTDKTTNEKGRVGSILVMDRIYNHSNSAIDNITSIKVKYIKEYNWESIRSYVNMGTSHIEIFTVSWKIAPMTPIGLDVIRIPGSNTLNISWDSTINTFIYRIYSNKSGNWQVEFTITHPQTWILDKELEDNIRYYYKIQAWNKDNLPSGISDVVSFFLTDFTSPPIPKNLDVKPVLGGDALKISWQINPEDTIFYDIWRKNTWTNRWEHLVNISHPMNSFLWSDVSLVNGTLNHFKIKAWDEVGLASNFSDVVSVVHIDYLAPFAPSNLTAEAVSETEIKLSWSPSNDYDVVNYLIFINKTKASTGGPYTFRAKVTTLDYLVTGLTENTAYYFVVSAIDEANNTSPYSIEVSSKTKAIIQRPKIVGTYPAQDSVNVAVDIKVLINFSIPMDQASVESVLSILPNVDYKIYWKVNDDILEIEFSNNLSYNTEYLISIGPAKATTGGTLKDAPYVLRFKTEKRKIPQGEIILEITSHLNNSEVKAGFSIIISGKSYNIEPDTVVTVTLGERKAFGFIDDNGIWAASILPPDIEGKYRVNVTAGNQNTSIIIIVKDDEKDDVKESKENNMLYVICISLLIIIILIIIIMTFLIMSMKSHEKPEGVKDKYFKDKIKRKPEEEFIEDEETVIEE